MLALQSFLHAVTSRKFALHIMEVYQLIYHIRDNLHKEILLVWLFNRKFKAYIHIVYTHLYICISIQKQTLWLYIPIYDLIPLHTYIFKRRYSYIVYYSLGMNCPKSPYDESLDPSAAIHRKQDLKNAGLWGLWSHQWVIPLVYLVLMGFGESLFSMWVSSFLLSSWLS